MKHTKLTIHVFFLFTVLQLSNVFGQNNIQSLPKNQHLVSLYVGKNLSLNKIVNPCGFDNGIKADVQVKSARDKYINLVNQICKDLNTDNIYIVIESPINNAAAVVYEGYHFIIIDHEFLENIILNTGTDFCLTGIIGHELGHHINGHTSGVISNDDRPYAELEADYFAGKALSKSSAKTLDDWYAVIDYLVPFENHPTYVINSYPGNLERKNAIYSGAINSHYFPPKNYKFEVPLEMEIKNIEQKIIKFLTENKLDTDWANETYSIKNGELIVTHDMGDNYPKDLWKSRYRYTIIKISEIKQINFQPFEGCCIDFITKKGGIRYTGSINAAENEKPGNKDHILTETMASEQGANVVLSTLNELITKLMYLYSKRK